MTTVLLLALALACYVAATLRYQRSLHTEGPPVQGPATGMQPSSLLGDLRSGGRAWLWLAFALHSGAIVSWTVQIGQLPTRTMPETLCLMAWMMIGLYLTLASAWKVEALGGFAAPAAIFLVVATLVTFPWHGEAPESPPRWLLSVHVGAVVLGYAAFLLASIVATLYFFQTFLLKKKKNMRGVLLKMPSLDTLDRVTYRLIGLGFPAMVVGMALGFFLRSEMASPRALSFDILLGLATCGVYAAYIHARIVSGWQGRKVNGLLLLGFVLLVAAYAGMVILPWSLHQHP